MHGWRWKRKRKTAPDQLKSVVKPPPYCWFPSHGLNPSAVVVLTSMLCLHSKRTAADNLSVASRHKSFISRIGLKFSCIPLLLLSLPDPHSCFSAKCHCPLAKQTEPFMHLLSNLGLQKNPMKDKKTHQRPEWLMKNVVFKLNVFPGIPAAAECHQHPPLRTTALLSSTN